MISSSPITPAAPGWFVVVLAACVSAAPTTVNIYAKFGDDVTLQPVLGSVTNETKAIIWKVGEDLAVELEKGHVEYFRKFKERGDFNKRTGELTIKSVSYEDATVYRIEIDSGPPNHEIHLFVLKPVPVPTIVSSCSENTSTCTLTCEGDIIRAQPVNYVWTSDNTEVQCYSKSCDITKEGSSGHREFSCKMINSISAESSKPLPNPFNAPESGPKISSGILVFFVLLAIVIAVPVAHRIKTGECFYNKTSMPWEGDFWKNTKEKQQPTAAAENNGTTTTPLQKYEETAMTH